MTIFGSMFIGFIIGVAAAPQIYALAGGLIGGIVGGIIGWFGAMKFISRVHLGMIKNEIEYSKFPPIQERVKRGWTFYKPSA